MKESLKTRFYDLYDIRFEQSSKIGHLIFGLLCASVSKRVLVQNLSHENEFNLHENEPVGGHVLKEWFPMTHFDTEAKCNLEMAHYILQSWTMRSQLCSLLIQHDSNTCSISINKLKDVNSVSFYFMSGYTVNFC